MIVIYPVVFTETKDEKNTVLVYIPDIDGATEGFGIADAIVMAKDYIGNFLVNTADEDFPKASEIDAVDVSKSEFADAGKSFVSLVDVDMTAFRRMQKTKTVRRNITLPEWLDDMAKDAKINVSALTQEALKQKLEIA